MALALHFFCGEPCMDLRWLSIGYGDRWEESSLLAWVLFRAKDIHSAQKIYLALFGFDKIEFPRVVESFLGSGADIVFLKTKELFHMPASDVRILFAMLTLSFVVVFFCQPLQYIWGRYIVSNQKLMYSVSMGVGVLLFITLLKMLLIPYSEFIYYNF